MSTLLWKRLQPWMWSPFIIIGVGIILRLFGLKFWSFGFDQVQIWDATQKILSGDLVLIGPRTGPAALFTGPLIYYVATLFAFLGLGYFSLVATTLFLAALTGGAMYWLTKRYWGSTQALLFVSLWAFSVFALRFDFVTWNPNLTFLAALLTFFPLQAALENKKMTLIDAGIVGLGMFLGYQAHFSGLLLIPLSFLFLLTPDRRAKLSLWLAAQAGWMFSLLPTLLFDLKHDWLNARGLQEFVGRIGESSAESTPLWWSFWKSLYTAVESVGALVGFNFTTSLWANFGLGLGVVGASLFLALRSSSKRSVATWLPLVWIALITSILGLYKGDKPPYYFFLLLPATLFLYNALFSSFLVSWRKSVSTLLGAFIVLGVVYSLSLLGEKGQPLSLLNVLRIQHFLQEQPSKARVTLYIPSGDEFGLQHLLQAVPTSTSDDTEWFVGYPSFVTYAAQEFDGAQVWSQLSEEATDSAVLRQDTFRVRTTQNIRLYRDEYYSGRAKDHYLLIRDGAEIGTLDRYDASQFADQFRDITVQKNQQWQYSSAHQMFVQSDTQKQVFVLTSTLKPTEDLSSYVRIF